MSTSLRSANGSKYPVSDVFTAGVLNETALEEFGVPELTATFAYLSAPWKCRRKYRPAERR